MADHLERIIESLRREHESVAAVAKAADDEQLTRRSGSEEWSLAQVLSHLGSGAEINLRLLSVAAALPHPSPGEDNQAVWARWDAATPREQADGFVSHDEALLDAVDGLSAEQRQTARVDLGFLPEPVPVMVALGMRLAEVANHSWDVRVVVDPAAEVDPESAVLLHELYAGPLSFLPGFSSKPDAVDRPIRLAVPGGGIEIDDDVRILLDVSEPTATLTGPPGAVSRLISGRLREPHLQDVRIEGDVTLAELHQVFPGY